MSEKERKFKSDPIISMIILLYSFNYSTIYSSSFIECWEGNEDNYMKSETFDLYVAYANLI